VVAEQAAQQELDRANADWVAFEPRVQEATETLTLHKGRLSEFEEGPLKNFNGLCEKEDHATAEEAATAGA